MRATSSATRSSYERSSRRGGRKDMSGFLQFEVHAQRHDLAGAFEAIADVDAQPAGPIGKIVDVDTVDVDARLPFRDRLVDAIEDAAARRDRVRLAEEFGEAGAEPGPHQLFTRPRAENHLQLLPHAFV